MPCLPRSPHKLRHSSPTSLRNRERGRDLLSVEQRSANMARIRAGNTRPELEVRRLVHSLGYRFRTHGRDLPGSPDIVLPRLRTVIFVHGCFWHRHRGCRFTTTPTANREFWLAKFSANVRRDRRASRLLRERGLSVLTIWECELQDSDKLRRRLARHLSRRATLISQRFPAAKAAASTPRPGASASRKSSAAAKSIT